MIKFEKRAELLLPQGPIQQHNSHRAKPPHPHEREPKMKFVALL